MTILIFILILSFLIIIHELGHFVTAIWMKVKVEEFGIGYPPRAMTLFKWRGIPFTLNWLPFGGFVKMEGEDGADQPANDTAGNTERDVPMKSSSKSLTAQAKSIKKPVHGVTTPQQAHVATQPFYAKSKRARLLILLAGVFMNFVFGVLAFAIVFTRNGIPELTNSPRVGVVAENSPAQTAGVQPGEVITQVQIDSLTSEHIADSSEFVAVVNENLGKTLTVTLEKDGLSRQVEIYARPQSERPAGEGAIGIAFDAIELRFYPWWQMPFRGMWVGLQQSVGLSWLILQAFADIFVKLFTQGQVPEGVAGPVGIVHQATKLGLFQEGWATILNFAGMLSINLAILNLLPIPALDGGRAMFVLLETFIGKRRRAQIEGRLNYVGFGVLLLLIVAITLKDVIVVVKDVVL